MRRTSTSYKKNILRLLLFGIILLIPALGYSQCPNNIKEAFIQTGLCSPAPVKWTVKYQRTWPSSTTARIRIRWDDGQIQNLTGSYIVEDGFTWLAVVDQPHSYTSTGNKCQYRPEAVLVLDGVECNNRVTKNVTVWDRDNSNGGQQRINPLVYRICVGTSATVTFRDNSQFNCTPPNTYVNRNKIHRWTQWVYNTFEANPATPRIPNVTVGGSVVAAATKGPIVIDPSPTIAPSAVSNSIFVPAGGNVGDIFEVKLRNWNICNPYDADTLDGAAPTDLVDGDNDPIFSYARVEVVAAPNPAFERRKTSFATAGDHLNFCPDETIYLQDLTTWAPGSNSGYTWNFYDNGGALLGTKSGSQVTHSFSAAGDYTVELIVKDGNAVGNCDVTITKPIKIVAAPTISIDVNGDNTGTFTSCKPDRANPFTATLTGTMASANPFTYQWQFYKRNSSASAPDSSFTNNSNTTFNVNYTKPGVYKVRLSAFDNLTGCSIFRESVIKIYDRPDAAFNANLVCAGSRTNFTNISKITAGIPTIVESDQITLWEWDFNNDGMVDLTRLDDADFNYFIAAPYGPVEPVTSLAGTYSVRLKVTTNKGCSHEITKPVKVKQSPVPAFTMNPPTGEICNGQSVEFINTTPSSPVIATYAWDLGPNATPQTASTASLASVVFANTTGADITYNVRLTVTTDSGCTNYIEKPIIIHPAPPVTISSDYDPAKPNCSPLSLNFLHSADPAIVSSYRWTVKELVSNTLVYDNTDVTNTPFSPSNIFVNNNTVNTNIQYEVQLIVKYQNGCEVNSNVLTITVKPNPVADFTATYLNDCSPKKVSFTPNILDGVYYEWTFSNGHIPDYSSTSPTLPDIIFTNKSSIARNYDVELTITAGSGCKSYVKKQVFVKPQPDPQFSIVGNKILCSGETLEFKNATPPGAVVSKFIWVWGDGTPNTEVIPPATASVFHTFRNNSPDTTASFKVKLLAISDCEAYSNQQSVIVEPKLIPDFEMLGANCSPAKISAQNKSKGPVIKVNWYIDGALQTSQGDNVTFDLINTTDNNKSFDITMRISSSNGCDTSITKPIIVYPQPKPSFTATPDLMVLPDRTVTITNNTPGTWTYEWDFGDGSPVVTDKDPQPHIYPTVGIYTIRLTISSGVCKASTTKEVTIYAKKPIADFAPDNVSGCKPVTVSFINKSQFADSTKYEWDFGDGKGKSTEVNPTYTYTEPGEYNVRLLARNFQNLADDTVKLGAVKVYDIPKANFIARPTYIELPDKPIYCTNQSQGADSYLWDFGDGTFSTESDPAHIYQDTGSYTITLIAFNKDGCSDTVFIENAVKAVWNGRVLIPNAFTPNLSALGIGSTEDNDYFFPKIEGAVSIDLKVFNRWGELMYRTTDVNAKGWDGYHNGKMCQQDVYVYTVKIAFRDGYELTQSGDVVLIR